MTDLTRQLNKPYAHKAMASLWPGLLDILDKRLMRATVQNERTLLHKS